MKITGICLIAMAIIQTTYANDNGEDLGVKIFTSPRVNWTMALQECANCNSTLLELHNSETIWGVTNHLQDESNISYWIGLRFYSDTNRFLWTDGSEAEWFRWEKGQPVFAQQKPCVKVSASSNLWSMGSCSEAIGFICRAIEVSPITHEMVLYSEAMENSHSKFTYGIVAGFILLLLAVMLIYFICNSAWVHGNQKPPKFALPTKPLRIHHHPS